VAFALDGLLVVLVCTVKPIQQPACTKALRESWQQKSMRKIQATCKWKFLLQVINKSYRHDPLDAMRGTSCFC